MPLFKFLYSFISTIYGKFTSPWPSPSPKSKPRIPKSQIQKGTGELASWLSVKLFFVKLRSRSRSGPRSGPEGPRTKDQRPGPWLTLKLVCHPSPPLNFSMADNHSKPLLYDFKHVSLILAFNPV